MYASLSCENSFIEEQRGYDPLTLLCFDSIFLPSKKGAGPRHVDEKQTRMEL